MKAKILFTLLGILLPLFGFRAYSQDKDLRLPAVPLLTNNPYFSVWSFSNHPGEDWPRHWTGSIQALLCFAKIDGRGYRLLGHSHQGIPVMSLKKTEVLPTRTIYTFEEAGVRIRMTFTCPLLPDDLVLLSEALTYVTWQMEPIDGKSHGLNVYFDVPGELAVNANEQEVSWSRQSSHWDVIQDCAK